MREFFQSLFGASSKEVVGFSTLILLLVITLFIPWVVDYFSPSSIDHYAKDQEILDSLVALIEANNSEPFDSVQNLPKPTYFNPNLASVGELIALGFKDNIAKRIINYRESGGKYRLPKDLYKIYGVDSGVVTYLYDYIEIPNEEKVKPSYSESKNEEIRRPTPSPSKAVAELPSFDINLADTAILKTIKGIGSILSARIVEFRVSLGGFIETSQLYEVYNLDSLVAISLIKKSYVTTPFMPEKIKINLIDIDNLAAHPYISWQQAKLIVAFRNQHGNFESGGDLLKVYGIEESDIDRLASYLSWSSSN